MNEQEKNEMLTSEIDRLNEFKNILAQIAVIDLSVLFISLIAALWGDYVFWLKLALNTLIIFAFIFLLYLGVDEAQRKLQIKIKKK
jgi:hypothetical protein